MRTADASAAWPIVRFGEIDSTNEEARRRAINGDHGPCWLVAERQTAGRGRQGRVWDSPPGNLFATALFGFHGTPAEASLTCFSAGLAVIDAARSCGVLAPDLKLKWPNDVLSNEAKLAGILIETGQGPDGLWIAAGFGVNVVHAPDVPGRRTARLNSHVRNAGLTAETYIAYLDIAFRSRLMSLQVRGFEPTRADWLAHAAWLGQQVELNGSNGAISGVMRGLDPDGALVLEKPDGSLHHVRAGEISILG